MTTACCPVPTSTPTAVPTPIPTVKPTMEGETNGPTLIPTMVPTLLPTRPGDTNSPSMAPTPLPSTHPSHCPTESPTVTPTLSPTPNPTQPGDTNAPSCVPSSTPSLSGVPRVVSARVRLNTVSRTSLVVSTEIEVSERFVGGTVYCGVSSVTAPSPITSTAAIKQQGHSTGLSLPAGHSSPASFFVDVLIDSLSPLTEYDVYCFAEDSAGSPGVFDSGLISTPVTTMCCHEIGFAKNPPRYVLSDMSQYFLMSEVEREDAYAVKVALSAFPTASLYVSLHVSGNSSLVSIIPTQILFTPQSTKMTGSFYVSAMSGNFSVSLSFIGVNFDEFRPNVARLPLAVIDSSVLVPPPQLIASYFDGSGTMMYLFFDSPTNHGAGIVSSPDVIWPCSLIFSFDGAESAGCRWEGSSQVNVFLNFYSSVTPIYPVVGGGVTVLPGVIQAHCAFSNCDNYEFSNVTGSTTIVVDPDVVVMTAVPVLSAVQHIFSCRNLSLDVSQSYNNGGRPWVSVGWQVSLVDPEQSSTILDASVTGLLSFLSALDIADLQMPIIIPSYLLEETEYLISFGLRNFMQSISEPMIFSSSKVSVSSGSGVSLFLERAGPASVTFARTSLSTVTLMTVADVSSCSKNTTLLAREAMALSYVWEVFDSGGVLLSDGDFSSTSKTPSTFATGSMAFEVGSTYEIRATANAVFTEGSGLAPMSSSVSYQVTIAAGDLVAGRISGVTSKVVRAGAAFSLDTREVVDLSWRPGDSPSNFQMQWSCKVLSAQDFGANCFETWDIEDSPVVVSSVLHVPADKILADYIYEISVLISSEDYGVHRSDTSSVIIESNPNTIEAFDGGFDPIQLSAASWIGAKYTVESKIVIEATIACSNLIGPVTAEWSMTSTPSLEIIPLDSIAGAPSRRVFSVEQVTKASGISFPLGFAKNTLTAGAQYTLRLSLTTEGVGGGPAKTSFAEMTMLCNTAPRSGILQVSPPNGLSFVTDFTMSASFWTDDIEDFPLRYHFKYQSLASYNPELPTQKASTLSTNKFTVTSLPAGRDVDGFVLTAIVNVVDIWDGMATTTIPVEVLSMFGSGRRRLGDLSAAASDFITEDLLPVSVSALPSSVALFDVGGFQKQMQKSLNYFVLLSEARCDLSPDCFNLNRSPCSRTTHTCGSCLTGYRGVFGDSNVACVNDTTPLLGLGDRCTSDDMCALGVCVASTCVAPQRTCPLGRDSGEICSGSGHGVCHYINYQGNALTPETCTVDNSYCRAVCSCQPGYVGVDCSIPESSDLRAPRDLLRRSMCSNIYEFTSILDPSPTNVETLVDYVADILFTDELITDESVDECGLALASLGDMLNTSSLLRGAPSATTIRIINMLSDLAEADLSSRLLNEIANLLDNFAQNLRYGIIPGEEGVGIASDNVRISYSYPVLSDLPNWVFKPPRTAAEDYYGSTQFSMTLSNTNELLTCSSFEDYAMFATIQWGHSPSTVVRSQDSLRTAIFNVVPLATADHNVSDTDQGSMVSFTLELQFYEPMALDVADLSCYELDLDTGSFDVCEFCNISMLTATSVTMTCVESREMLCPVSSNVVAPYSVSGAVSDVLRTLQSSSLGGQGKYYAAVETTFEEVVVFRGGITQQVKSATGMISFMCVLLGCVLIGFIVLRQWDERDRTEFVHQRKYLVEKGQFRFDISAAFDDRGTGFVGNDDNVRRMDPICYERHCVDDSELDDSEVSSKADFHKESAFDTVSISTF